MSLIIERRLEINPLKLDDGVGIDPFGWNFSVKSEFFDFNRSELVDGFRSSRIEEHSNFEILGHVMNVFKKFFAFKSSIRFTFVSGKFIVFLFHVFCRVGHFDHDLLNLLHLN